MADGKHWAKLWYSALSDDNLLALPPGDRWAWAALLAYTRMHGNKGIMEMHPQNQFLAVAFGCPPGDVLATIRRLPNIAIEDGKCNNKITLQWKNWHKYAEDLREEKPGFLKVGNQWKSRVEHIFAGLLRELAVVFKEQQRFPHGKAFYTVDFYIPSKQIAFEIQGPEHATKKYRELDQRKRASLIADYGVLVHAIDNTSILQNIEFVRTYVIDCIESGSTASSPYKRREEKKRKEEKRQTTTLSFTLSGVNGKQAYSSEAESTAVQRADAIGTASLAPRLPDQERAAVRRVWDYYIGKFGKNPKLLTLTSARLQKGLSRYREALAKCDGDCGKAEQLLVLCVDALAASEWHSGANPGGKKFDSWDKQLFPNQEKFEWWLERT